MKKLTVCALFLVGIILPHISAVPARAKISPMAKLMREMLLFIKTERLNIESGKAPQLLPKEFTKIKTARVTRGKKFAPRHNEYVASFMDELGNYYQVNDSVARKAFFNALVITCVTCHKEECPGPVRTIQENLF